MRPVIGTLGANTLVILTQAEMMRLREALEGSAAGEALSAGIKRGTAHLEAEFNALQKAKKQGK